MGSYYSVNYANLWMGLPEGAFRSNQADVADTTNAAADSYRRFPIRWTGSIQPRRLKHKIRKLRASGKGLDYSHAYREGYEPVKFRISGEIVDFAFLHQLTGLVNTTGSYVHTATVYQGDHASYTAPSTPTFTMLQKVGNVVGAETEYLLYLGCKITKFTASWREGGRLNGTLEIECANVIDGTALTTEPDYLESAPYYFDPTSDFSFKVSTVAMDGYVSAFNFKYENGQYLRKLDYLLLPDAVLEGFRTIEMDFTWVAEDDDNVQLDPETDSDVDITHDLTNGTDTFEMDWYKASVELLSEAYDYNDFYLGRRYRVSLNPNEDSYLDLVETNSNNDDYYENDA